MIAQQLDEASSLLDAALISQPDLTGFGFGVFEGTPDRTKRFNKERAELVLAHRRRDVRVLEEVAWSAAWVRHLVWQKTINTRHTSYGYKHMVERFVEQVNGKPFYVSNGLFIAAAIGVGVRWRRCDRYSPNLWLAVDERTLNRLPEYEGI